MIKYTTSVYLRAEGTKPVEIQLRGEAKIIALDAAAGSKGPRRFSMTAYTGGPMRPKLDPPFPHPVIVDLAGLDLTKQRFPALKDHDSKQLVGHTERIATDGKSLTAEGVVSGTGEAATEVVAAHDNGFTWQVSMGAVFGDMKLIPPGSSATVNGRSVNGPVFIARKGRLRELSFLTLGADDDTAATIAAEAAELGEAMSFTDWLKANGFQPEAQLTDSQKVILHASYTAEGDEAGKMDEGNKARLQAMLDAAPKPKTAKEKIKAVKLAAAAENADDAEDSATTDDHVDLRAQLDAIKREQAIYRLCGDKHVQLAAQAIDKDWDDDTIKLAIEAAELRAVLPQSMQIRTRRAADAPADGTVLEAACAIAGNLDNVEKKFDEKALNEAAGRFRNGIGLQELFLTAAWANGYTGHSMKQDFRGVLEAAFGVGMQASGFSTVSLPGILGNTANKFLLAGFMGVENVWRQISAVRSVTDFKTITSYRMTGAFQYMKVGPDGELKHATTGEESFTNKLDTYGIMYAITRQDIINDDLGALTAVPRKIGRGAGLKINDVFWTAFCDNASFFTGAHLSTSSAFSIASLSTVEGKFLDKVDADNKPLAISPAILLVPTALSTLATQLMNATEIRDTTASTKYATNNPFAGKWRPLTSAYLGNASYGNSTTSWYLLANPEDVAVIETVFLNGREQPTVESADMDFNTLGVQMRGYHDFGVSKQDARGGVKANS